MERWEYKCYELKPDSAVSQQSALNNLGSDGWELVLLTPGETTKQHSKYLEGVYTMWFKRRRE